MFLLGIWKNYDELEENLSLDELLFTINAHRKNQKEIQKFQAAIQGIQLPDGEEMSIDQLSGTDAAIAGFGIGMGIGHSSAQVVNA